MSNIEPSQFGTAGASVDTPDDIEGTSAASGAEGIAEEHDKDAADIVGAETRIVVDEAAYARLASPALTGTPTAPTAASGTSTTQIATTAFVLANGGSGGSVTYGDTANTATEGNDPRIASYVIPSPATPSGGSDTATLTAWLAAAKAADAIALLPPGQWQSASGLAYTAAGAQVQGFARGVCTINFADNSNHGLTVGNGTAAGNGNYGRVANLSLIGPSGTPTKNGKAGLLVDGLNYAGLEYVDVQYFDKAFDFIDNCYGTYGLLLTSKYSTCNVGVNCQTGAQSGSDLVFYNCWVSGRTRGVSISGGATGINFHGGQVSGGLQANGTFDAMVTLGSDYDTADVATTGLHRFDSMDFENWNDGHAIHVYAIANAAFQNIEFLATSQTADHFAAGILYAPAISNSKLSFDDCTVTGYFQGYTTGGALGGPNLTYLAGAGSATELNEKNWSCSTPSEVNGTAISGGNTAWMPSLQIHDEIGVGFSITRNTSRATLQLDSHLVVPGGNAGIQVSTDLTGDTLNELLVAGNNLSDVTTAATARTNIGAAALASPAFTGTPTAPTATSGTNTTQLATTAFVTTAVGAGSGSAATPSITPLTLGYYGWSVDPELATSSAAPTSGRPAVMQFMATQTGPIGHLTYGVVTAGTTLTAGENVLGIYDTGQTTAGEATLLGTTADQSTNMEAVGTYSAALNTAVEVTAGQLYYIALLCVGTTTPAIARGAGGATVLLVEAGLTGLNMRYAYTAATGLTALPATIAASGLTAGSGGLWCVIALT